MFHNILAGLLARLRATRALAAAVPFLRTVPVLVRHAPAVPLPAAPTAARVALSLVVLRGSAAGAFGDRRGCAGLPEETQELLLVVLDVRPAGGL